MYGPHCALMYGKLELLEQLAGINHYFIDEVPYKIQPGNKNFEMTYSMSGLTEYIKAVHDHHYPEDQPGKVRERFARTFDLFAAHEEALGNKLIDFLKTKESVTIIGEQSGDRNKRVATIAFYHETLNSKDIVEQVDPHNIGIRYGDFYAKKIVEAMGIEDKGGPVRVSFVHYNTMEEVDKLIGVLDKVLS